jgi:transposase
MTDGSIITAGIDTAKQKLDVAIHGKDGVKTFKNIEAGFEELAQHLAAASVRRVGIEATGGYERSVVRYLQKAGFEVIILQPLQVRAFAKMKLQRAKNDTIDAKLIAQFTHLFDAHNKMSPDPRFDALADWLTFIEQIEADAIRLQTRLEHTNDKRLRHFYADDIARLEKRAAAERRKLAEALREHTDLATRLDLVLSIPGIGAVTALSLVVRMPELGKVSREEAAALAGLAPFVHQSGKFAGQTHIGGGRAGLRRSLYLAAFAASARWNKALVALYRRLIARGRSHKAAVIACARKLLIYANTVVARGTPWTDETATA